VQRVTGINIFMITCLSQTGNRAVGDFLRVLGTKQAISCDVSTDMVGLRDRLAKWSWASEFHGLSGLCRTRWSLAGDFAAGVITRYPEI
jgi:hypothetical protein